MKAKKLLAMILSLTMILGLCTVGAKADYAESTVAVIGSTEYSSVETAIKAARDNDVVQIVKAGTYSFNYNNMILYYSITIEGIEGRPDDVVLKNGSNVWKGITVYGRKEGNHPVVTIKNLVLDGNIAEKPKILTPIVCQYGDLTLENVTIKNAVRAAEVSAAETIEGSTQQHFEDGLTSTITAKNVTTENITGTTIKLEALPGVTGYSVGEKLSEEELAKQNTVKTTAIFNYDDNCNFGDTYPTALVRSGVNGVAGKMNHIFNLIDAEGKILESTDVLPGDVTTNDFISPAAYKDDMYGTGTRTYLPAVAQIGEVNYGSVQDAFDAAAAGDTVKLLKDVNLTATQEIVKNLTLDLNGKNITAADARALLVKSGEVSIVDNSTGSTKGTITTTKTEGSSLVSGSSVIRVGSTGTDKAAVTIGAGVTIEAPFTYGVTAFGTNEGGVELVVNGTIHAHGTEAAISGNGNAGNKGAVTINEGAVITSDNTEAIYHPQGDTLTVKGGTITGATGIYQKSGTLSITGGTIIGNGAKAAYTSTGDDCVPTGDALVIDSCAYPGGAPTAEVSGGMFKSVNAEAVASYAKEGIDAVSSFISGGTFSTTPDKSLLADDMAIYPVEGKGVEVKAAPAEGADEFSLDPTKTTVTTQAVYEGKVIEAEFDEDAVEAIRSAADDAGASTVTFVVKLADSVTPPTGETEALVFDMHLEDKDTGKEVPYSGGEAEVRIPFTGEANKIYTVYYKESDDSLTNMNARYVDGYLVFRTSHFSTYLVTSIPAVAAEAFRIGFAPTGDPAVYGIVLYPDDSAKYINRFTAAHMTFELTQGLGHINYEITSNTGAHIQLNDALSASGVYQFYVHESYGPTVEETWSDVSGRTIQIGTVKFSGYGQNAEFKITDATVNTTTTTDNIVVSSLSSGDLEMDNTTPTATDAETALIDEITLNPVTKDLTINVTFPNTITNQTLAYQDMTVTVTGGDLTNDIVVKLGTDMSTAGITSVTKGVYPYADSAETTATFTSGTYATPDLMTATRYQVVLKDILTKDVQYKVIVTGAGYRTTSYNVLMTGNKTLTFWNNVMDNNTVIETGKSPVVNVTYLAGDIVKDAQINIYDLSAVVSYFGTTSPDIDVGATSSYAKYDLNRDGKIDSIDVAYVLVSWGK